LRLYSFFEGLVRVTGLRVQNSLWRGSMGNSSFRQIVGKVVESVRLWLSLGVSLVSVGGPIITHISTTSLRAALHSFTAKLTLIYILYIIILLLSIVYLYLYLLYIY
jgi:hypothetical protein